MSHLGCGTELFDTLAAHPRIQGYRLNIQYNHFDNVLGMLSLIHKSDNALAISMDEVVYNMSFNCKPLCRFVKFVFYIRPPGPSLPRIMKEHDYSRKGAESYYCFRLRGLYEYSRRASHSVVVTDPLDVKGMEQLLNLKTPLLGKPVTDGESLHSQECEDCYNKYLSLMTAKA
jgi:hypothetical protein